MTEPPRPPGEGYPDPNSAPPPTSGGGAYPPPTSGGGAYPPAGGYPPPGGGYPPQGGGYPPQGGGYPPQQGGYPPQGGGYPPQQGGYYGGAAPAGFANSEEKTWALVAHLGGALGAFVSLGVLGFVGPLVAYLAKGQQSPAVRAHAVAALNFQLLWSIIAFVLVFVSWCLLFIPSVIVLVLQVIFGIVAGVKANEGHLYRYPMSVNMIK
ncbi:hypothetical protein SAMN05421684_2014 [Asanoa ishikariensis]|uniref:DUF4870 domain-containing protein n=1 Tax=Asanoa ishikariensis TaxID=137265 RepID=A0A1H3NES6_9ACTN|nr:DUF4870 domain-containing protein [Asanoa ishikariensis]SDY87170.1 hypothetical protein SAMN05421684_2014 [Asanoa ishikariensis]